MIKNFRPNKISGEKNLDQKMFWVTKMSGHFFLAGKNCWAKYNFAWNNLWYENHCLCYHTVTKIDEVTRKNISTRFFSNAVDLKCAPVAKVPLLQFSLISGNFDVTALDQRCLLQCWTMVQMRSNPLFLDLIVYKLMQKTKDLTPLEPSFNQRNKHRPGLNCTSAW